MTEPFLKWAGGKRWLAHRVAAAYVCHGGRLVEPFAGSAAVFFEICPKSALLADTNHDLIATYRALVLDVEAVIHELSRWRIDESTFRAVRAARPEEPVAVAARFMYLNRTAFNGLYRVNREGQFNVPFGPKPGTQLVRAASLRACAAALARAECKSQDFRLTLSKCGAGDFVYVDPPYTVRHNNNGFNRYNAKLFSWTDQEDLARSAAAAVERGADVVVSNADHDSVRALYPRELFRIISVARLSRMAASVEHRGPTTELLIASGESVVKDA